MKRYEIEYLPRFRESDHEARIGLRAYLNYFQDIAAGHYHKMGKGNDTIHERYGAAWVYTKYHLKIYGKTDFDHLLRITSWISKLDQVRSWQEMEIKRGEELLCEGRLESCLINLSDLSIARTSAIELPDDLVSDERTSVGAFSRRFRMPEDVSECYTYRVRYCDIDNNRHMNNLHYLDMFMNAFELEFYDRCDIAEFEIHYINQAYYGEELRICCAQEGDTCRLFALNAAGNTVAACQLAVVPRGEG